MRGNVRVCVSTHKTSFKSVGNFRISLQSCITFHFRALGALLVQFSDEFSERWIMVLKVSRHLPVRRLCDLAHLMSG